MDKDYFEIYKKADIVIQELSQEMELTSYWKMFRLLVNEIIPIGSVTDYLEGTLVIKGKEAEYSVTLLEKLLRNDPNSQILIKYSRD